MYIKSDSKKTCFVAGEFNVLVLFRTAAGHIMLKYIAAPQCGESRTCLGFLKNLSPPQVRKANIGAVQ